MQMVSSLIIMPSRWEEGLPVWPCSLMLGATFPVAQFGVRLSTAVVTFTGDDDSSLGQDDAEQSELKLAAQKSAAKASSSSNSTRTAKPRMPASRTRHSIAAVPAKVSGYL